MNPFQNAALRREKLRSSLAGHDLDAMLVSSVPNVTYLTGFQGEASHLVVSKSKDILVSDARFTEQIRQECPGLEALIRPPNRKTLEMVAQAINDLGATKIGFESAILTVADFELLKELLPAKEWKPATSLVETQRMVKDENELACIRKAILQAENGFLEMKARLKAGKTEKQIADDLDNILRNQGARCAAFPLIVAGGPRAALPHAIPGNFHIGVESHLLVDWGATDVSGYRSDLTRVLISNYYRQESSKMDPKGLFRKIYEVALKAQKAAFAAIRPGVLAQEIDNKARQVIADEGFAEYFGHGLGHGIGLQIHEAPWIRPSSDTVLLEGMIFTLEPGIYLPGFAGVRIEDDVMVTREGAVQLTSLPKEWEDQVFEV